MCNIVRRTKRREVYGWKVVWMPGKRARSLLTGKLYPPAGPVPVWYDQRGMPFNIFTPFLPVQPTGIQQDTFAYGKDMIGKTCVFKTEKAAQYQRMNWLISVHTSCRAQVVVVRVRLYGAIYKGHYGCPVWVGTHMEVIYD